MNDVLFLELYPFETEKVLCLNIIFTVLENYMNRSHKCVFLFIMSLD